MEVLIEIKRAWKESKRQGEVEEFEEVRLDERKEEERLWREANFCGKSESSCKRMPIEP